MGGSMRAIVLIVCGLIGFGALAGCGSDEVEEDEPEASGQTQPADEGTTSTTETNEFGAEDAEAARLALEGVISRDIGDPDYHVTGFRTDPAVSADLIAQIEQL